MILSLLLLFLPAVLNVPLIGEFGAAVGDTIVGNCDPCVTDVVGVMNLTVWGYNASTLQVFPNGVITVDSGDPMAPPAVNLPEGTLPLFAPFWVFQSVDIDCVAETPGCPGVFYRHSVDYAGDISNFLPMLQGSAAGFTPDNMFVATWVTIADDESFDKLNIYQTVILWDRDTSESWVVYTYEDIAFGGVFGFGPDAGIQGDGGVPPVATLPIHQDTNSDHTFQDTATCGSPPGQFFSRLDVVVNWDVCYCERPDSASCDYAAAATCDNACGGHGKCEFILGGGGTANCSSCDYGWDLYPNNCSNWVCGDCGNPAAVVACDYANGCQCQPGVFLDHEGRCASGIGLFGDAYMDMEAPSVDDLVWGPNDISGIGLTIFGTEMTDLSLSDNGVFSFNGDPGIDAALGGMLPLEDFVVAPYWEDVDPELMCPPEMMPRDCNKLLIRMEMNPVTLDMMTDQFLPAQKAAYVPVPDAAIVATYAHVMPQSGPGHNFFQSFILMNSASQETWLVLNYQELEWGSADTIIGIGGESEFGFNLPWGNTAEAKARLPVHATCGSRAGRYVMRIDVWPPEHAGFCGCDDAEDVDCTVAMCVDDFDCHEKGICSGGVCDCDFGWHMAPYCNYFTPNCTGALNDCSGHGDCVSVPEFSTDVADHECSCDMDWGTTADCSVYVPCEQYNFCEEGLGHGYCYDDDFCVCGFGWDMNSMSCDVFAPDCNHLANCSAHGTCQSVPDESMDIADHSCDCDVDYESEDDCSVFIACSSFGECSGHGDCVADACVCDFGYRSTTSCDVFAADCTALSDCSGHGTCGAALPGTVNPLYHTCTCDPGFEGADCSESPDCSALNDCSEHGTCMRDAEGDSYCACEEGWAAKDDCGDFFLGMAAAEFAATAAVVGGVGLVCLVIIVVGIVLLVLFFMTRRGVAVAPATQTKPDQKLEEFTIAEPKKEPPTKVVVAPVKQDVEEEVVVADVSDSSSSSSDSSDEEPEKKEPEVEVAVVVEAPAPVIIEEPVVVAPPKSDSDSDSDSHSDKDSDSDKDEGDADSDKGSDSSDSDKGSGSDKDSDSEDD